MHSSNNDTLISNLKKTGVLHSPSLIQALKRIDRADFVPKHLASLAYADTALPIGEGQTISQPYTVVFMLEQLQVRPGDVVLEIGSGSGWQTALLAHLVGPVGLIYALELLPPLCKQGKDHLKKYPRLSQRIRLLCQSGERGYTEGAPFDRIIAAAEVVEVPTAWREQLKTGGRMVYPKNGALVTEVKKKDSSFESAVHPGFTFVPFVRTCG